MSKNINASYIATRRKNQTIGIELELYTNKQTSAMTRYLKSHSINNIEAVKDQSLHDDDLYGTELRLKTPVKYRSIKKSIKDFCSVMNDQSINPTVVDDMDAGSTGIHVHFGLSPELNTSMIDMLRLLKNVHLNEPKIESLANRPCCRWARSMKQVVDDVDIAISNLKHSSSPQPTKRLSARLSHIGGGTKIDAMIKFVGAIDSYTNMKYWVVNVSTIIRKINQLATVVEMRECLSRGDDAFFSFSLNTNTDRSRLIEIESGLYLQIRKYIDGDNNKIKFSVLNEILTEIKQYESPVKHRLLLNKYISSYDSINPLLTRLCDLFGFTKKLTNMCTDDGIGYKYRLLYDSLNSHIDRALDAVDDIDGYMSHIGDIKELTKKRTGNVANLVTNWFTELDGYHYDDNRYYGINATNIGEFSRSGRPHLNTIEFRWASTSIAQDETKFNEYVQFLNHIVDISLTGESDMIWGDYVLRDLSDTGRHKQSKIHTIGVFKDSKFIGRINCNRLSNRLTKRNNKKMNDILNAYKSTNKKEYKDIAKAQYISKLNDHKKFVEVAKLAIYIASMNVKNNKNARKHNSLDKIRNEMIDYAKKKNVIKLKKYIDSNNIV